MKPHTIDSLTNLILDARVVFAKLEIETTYLEALDSIYADSSEKEIPQKYLDDLRWGPYEIEMQIERKLRELASIILRDQVDGLSADNLHTYVHPLIASNPMLLEAYEEAREEVKDEIQRGEMIAIWLQETEEQERADAELEHEFQQMVAAAVAEERWSDLKLPSPEYVAEQLGRGEQVDLRGSTFEYKSGMIWVTNAYGQDSCFSGKPDVLTAKDLLLSAARDEEYGPVPH